MPSDPQRDPQRAPEPAAARPPAKRRSAVNDIRRNILAALVFVPLALASGAFSSAVVLDTREPQVSHAIYGALPKAKIRLGDLAIAEAVGDIADPAQTPGTPAPSTTMLAAQLPREIRLAIEARALSGLGDTPYASGALRQLAFFEGDPVRRRALLDLARRISRRDISAAAQIAELQFREGELGEGLATLDSALAMSDALDAHIFPLMLDAARDPAFAAVLRPRLARDPTWSERIARHAAATPTSAPLFARVVGAFPHGSRARAVDYGAPLIDRLAADLRPGAAFAAYAAYAPSPQDPAAFGTRALTPLDWRLVDSIDIGARMLRRDTGATELFAQPRRSGEVARILLRLDPGRYVLRLALTDPRGTGGTIRLARTCVTEGRELDAGATATSLDTARIALRFVVPADCPYQSLRLALEAGGEPISVLVEQVALEPVRAAR